jgi:gluconolactonase
MDLATRKMELFVHFDETMGEGKADGMRVDKEGNLYVTGPGGIWLVDPGGEALGLIRMPECAANLCFDGKGIFITATSSIYRVDTKIPPAV